MSGGIRNGMWVEVVTEAGPKVGIAQLSADAQPGECAVHLTSEEKGETLFVLPRVQMSELKQARRNQIPEARRPDELRSKRLGYA